MNATAAPTESFDVIVVGGGHAGAKRRSQPPVWA